MDLLTSLVITRNFTVQKYNGNNKGKVKINLRRIKIL